MTRGWGAASRQWRRGSVCWSRWLEWRIIRDSCEVACGTGAEQAFRESMGYVALVLGGFSIALAVRGRRVLATAVSSVGATACAAAVVEGLSHLS
jgi:hypothetical protein